MQWPVRRLVASFIAIAVVLTAMPMAARAEDGERRPIPEDRYALVDGCYVLRDAASDAYVTAADASPSLTATRSAAMPYRFVATDLGRYLLFSSARTYLAFGDGAVTHEAQPSPAADWELVPLAGGAYELRLAAGPVLAIAGTRTWRFELADDCATFPDIGTQVRGPQLLGATPFEAVRGFIDSHAHLMSYEFLGGRVHCGRPWHPYGVEYALVDCPDHQVGDGSAAVLENFFRNGLPTGTHDPVGWPTFHDWPAPNSLTHEGTYFRWLERMWRSGLRVIVNLLVNNRVLCELYPLKQNPCDDMASVRLQAQRIHEFERYIDAQSGGPGEGWFRIVDDPFEARRVANAGKLAVVLGMEVSEPFGCGLLAGVPRCTAASFDRQLDEMTALGLRHIYLVHKFDNAFGGTTFDGGTLGTIINVGNFYATAAFWDVVHCDSDNTGVHDNNQVTNADGLAIVNELLRTVAVPAAIPVYPSPNHCNPKGLTSLGAHAIEELIERHLIVDVDHMSVRTRQDALTLLEEKQYPGVVSGHSWDTPDANPRIYALGGFIGLYPSSPRSFVNGWRQQKTAAGARFEGLGFGADTNGIGNQPGPFGADRPNRVRYPFTGLGGVEIDQQVSGSRVYDVNVDGVAHFGLFADWIEALRLEGGNEIVDDLARGADAYLGMWERATGIRPRACVDDVALSAVRPGMTPEDVLRAVGQPEERKGTTFRYCVAAGSSTEGVVSFDATGRVAALPVAASNPTLPATGGDGSASVVAVVLAALGLASRWVGRGRRRP